MHTMPSIADGTVSEGLIEGLQHLIDEYGLAGVRSTLDELAGVLPVPEPPSPDPCSSCGATWDECNGHIRSHGRGCCARCYMTNTHGPAAENLLAVPLGGTK